MRARIEFHEHVGRGATELKRGLGGDRLDVSDTANAICSKDLSVVAHPAHSTSRCSIRKPETARTVISGEGEMIFMLGCAACYFARFLAVRSTRTFPGQSHANSVFSASAVISSTGFSLALAKCLRNDLTRSGISSLRARWGGMVMRTTL